MSRLIDLIILLATVINTGFLVVLYDRMKWRK